MATFAKAPVLHSGKYEEGNRIGNHRRHAKKAQASTGSKRETPAACDPCQVEESLVQKIDHVLASLEQNFSSWEKSGIAFVDSNCESAYRLLSQAKGLIAEEGLVKVERLARMVKDHFPDLSSSESVSEQLSAGLEYLDGARSQLDETYTSRMIQIALQSSRTRLLNVSEMPRNWSDNSHIKSGYRFCASSSECLWSIFHVHNETCNIWTHLLGGLGVLWLGFFHLPSTSAWQQGTWVDRIPMVLFVVAAFKCMMCSVAWHTFCNISKLSWKMRFACVDYLGITVLISASILTTEYTALYCHPFAQAFYMFITLISAVSGVIFACNPEFDKPQARPIRALFFCSFALAGLLGGLHASYYYGFWPTFTDYYLPVIKSLLCYGTGVIFYGLLIPERWFPGSVFDYFGASHNIWHAFVAAGVYYHYQAMIDIFDKAKVAVCS